MLAFNSWLAFIVALSDAFTGVLSAPPQVPFHLPTTKPRELRGRFLHITDLHPDPYYKVHSSQSSACHRKKPKRDRERAGYYGAPYSECDAPYKLTNFTLDYIAKHWASEIDFVIWTGDNARHDNDRKLPRTTNEIYMLNRAVASKMESIFTSRGIPVVPSLGNNDVWPHNIMTPGPNSITNEFSSIWKSFIPFPSYQVFQRGAYYSVEVIPGSVAVISLNTMYFYDSNKAVEGCLYTEPSDPGNLQFDWLEVQLKVFRNRNMKVWISGHVPPSPGNFFPECYTRYVELSLRFQDTLLGHLFGHMNADHFFFVEADDLLLTTDAISPPAPSKHEDLYQTLLDDFSTLPKSPKKIDMDNYAIINVSPPVVPNPYLPTFRIFAYNTSGPGSRSSPSPSAVEVEKKRKHGHKHGDHGNKASQCKSAEHQNTWKCKLNEPWFSDPKAPSRQNTKWTPLGYAQYYLPHLEGANKTHRPKFELEYMTLPVPHLHPGSDVVDGGGKFWYPFPLRNLPGSLRNATLLESKYAPYGMKDLTIGSWMELARRLGDAKHSKKLRKRFKKYMYFGGEEQ